MKNRLFAFAIVAVGIFLLPQRAAATTITFEGFAPSGSLVNVNPGAPYSEAGFTLTPINFESAVFDSAALVDFPGDVTDFFGFEETNVITLTGPATFSLQSLLLGPTTLATGPTTITIVGNVSGGGTLLATFPSLTTATLATLNWSDLTSVVFRVTDDSGLDNIALNSVPEPTSVILLGMGGLGWMAKVRRHKRQDA